METVVKIWNWLRSLPFWLRAVVLALVASLALIFSATSCGSVQRIVIDSTYDSVKVESTINKKDSTSVDITVNPNFSTK